VARAALLQSEDPLVKAYTACILANIAFLAPGQEKVLEAHGVKPLVKLLKAKDADKKITLHSTAAVQNLTYKNTACCQQVLEEGGESTGDVARDKAITDFDLKLLAKWSPALYGDKVALTNHDGTANPMLTLSAALASELADLIDVTPRPVPAALPAPSEEPKGRGP
jgi:hypothetical protein